MSTWIVQIHSFKTWHHFPAYVSHQNYIYRKIWRFSPSGTGTDAGIRDYHGNNCFCGDNRSSMSIPSAARWVWRQRNGSGGGGMHVMSLTERYPGPKKEKVPYSGTGCRWKGQSAGVFSICDGARPRPRPSPEVQDPRQAVWPLQGSFRGCAFSGESLAALCRSPPPGFGAFCIALLFHKRRQNQLTVTETRLFKIAH